MRSVLNGLSLQHYITKRLKKTINVYQDCGLMKIDITGKDLSFQYRKEVNMLLSRKKSQNIYLARRSGHNVKCKKQVNLLIIEDGGMSHYTAIKNIFRLLRFLNATHKGAYNFCMNCLNSFCTGSARDKHYEYCSSNGHVKLKMPSEKEKWLKFHDEQY